MKHVPLGRRSVTYYWRANLALLLGVIVGTATLTGALLVGDSMRGSLRDRAVRPLGDVVGVIRSSRFTPIARWTESIQNNWWGEIPVPAIIANGVATSSATGRRENLVHIYGFDRPLLEGMQLDGLDERDVIINDTLAAQLGASVGDDLILSTHEPSAVSAESLLGRRGAPPLRARLTISQIIASAGFGGFSTAPQQTRPANAFASIETLQRLLNAGNRCNAYVFAMNAETRRHVFGSTTRVTAVSAFSPFYWGWANHTCSLSDFGLATRVTHPAFALESENMLLPPLVEARIRRVVANENLLTSPVISYLANEIARVDTGTGEIASSIPYSTVAAIESSSFVAADLPNENPDSGNLNVAPGQILLNAWSAKELGAAVGDTIRLTYYVVGDFGELKTEHTDFRLAGVVAMRETGIDQTFTPEYPGVTDSDSMRDWDPPFPVDLKLVRDEDETYWDEYRATPKAFISLEDGERLWAEKDERLGKYTSMRIRSGDPAANVDDVRAGFEKEFCENPTPQELGIQEIPVLANALRASQGSTDFSGLFTGFSLFLIASAAMLVALLFRLNIERRAGQIGVLLAMGYAPRKVRGLLLAEATWVSALGAAIGLFAAVGYAWLMLEGLRTWWSAAANAPFLTLHVTAGSLLIGFVLSLLVAHFATRFAIRGMLRGSVRALLAGDVRSDAKVRGGHSRGVVFYVMIGSAAAALVVLAWGMWLEGMDQAGAFFGGGALLLTAALCFVSLHLKRTGGTAGETRPTSGSPAIGRGHTLLRGGSRAMDRLGWRNAGRHRGRSMTTIALLASATFVVTSLAAFRLDPSADTNDKHGPAGGYALFAEATTPLIYDLNSASGRAALDLPDDAVAALEGVTVTPFRLRSGDAASCTNLYLPTQPRILGAPPRQVERGGFEFGGVLQPASGAVENPWELLNQPLADGAIPVIGDEAAVQWQLHSGLGKDLQIQDERGNFVTLRFVALLRNSTLQDELIISETNFKRLFPSIDGYGFFLIDTPAERAEQVATALESSLGAYGFDVGRSADRLRDYLAVQNTYITTFQTLGGLGLVLGAFGLIAILLRNVWERRSELALMLALGFARRAIARCVLAENVLLVVAGLLCGAVPAGLAILPTLLQRPGELPWVSLGCTLGAVAAIGIAVGALATHAALRAPLVPALRRE